MLLTVDKSLLKIGDNSMENMEFNWTISRITVGKDEMKAMQDNFLD